MKISKPQKIDFNTISTIIFDWGGVITELQPQACIRAFEKLGHKSFGKYLEPVQNDDLYFRFETGEASTKEFYDRLRSEMQINHPDQKIDEAYCNMLGETPGLHIDILNKLGEYFQLILLSNTNIVHTRYYNNYLLQTQQKDFQKLFSRVYYSYEIGYRKPGNEIFQKVLRENQLKAYETLFLDDAKINIESARSLGIECVHITTGNSMIDIFRNWID